MLSGCIYNKIQINNHGLLTKKRLLQDTFYCISTFCLKNGYILSQADNLGNTLRSAVPFHNDLTPGRRNSMTILLMYIESF